jgi:isocitrate dehydrogenase
LVHACIRPVRYFGGTLPPVRHPERIDVVTPRENVEDVHASTEWAKETPQAERVIEKASVEKHEDAREHSHVMKESSWSEKSPS